MCMSNILGIVAPQLFGHDLQKQLSQSTHSLWEYIREFMSTQENVIENDMLPYDQELLSISIFDKTSWIYSIVNSKFGFYT